MIKEFIVLAQSVIGFDFALMDIAPILQFLICNLKLFGKKPKAAIEKNQIVNNYYINGDMIINNK